MIYLQLTMIKKSIHKLGNFRISFNKKYSKILAFLILSIFILLLVSNFAVYFLFKNKTYPKTNLNNTNLSSVKFNNLEEKINSAINKPNEIKLSLKDKSITVNSDQLGLKVNTPKIKAEIQNNRHILPLLNFFIKHQTNASYEINNQSIANTLESMKDQLETPPHASYIKLQDQQFIVVPSQPLLMLDSEKSNVKIQNELNSGITEIELAYSEVPAPESNINVDDEALKLNNSLTTAIVIKYDQQTKTLNKLELTNLYETKENTYVVSAKQSGNLIDATAKQFGMILGNRSTAVTSLVSALSNNKKATITLEPAPQKLINYSYCVATKGVDTSFLGEFKSKLASVYADSKGWGMNGLITFSPVASGCNFTAWLTAADLVPSFSSSICDNIWSCRVGNNVIINFDRWTGASLAWNGAGGSLDSYRSMVINHETGHWLGFSHRYCGGSGQAAPVMQQQSISLQGCSFNPWPSTSELQTLKSSKGL